MITQATGPDAEPGGIETGAHWTPEAFTDSRLTLPTDDEGTVAFGAVRQFLLAELEKARSLGTVHWESEEVTDRLLDIGGLAGRTRHAPSFALRQAFYEPGGCGCPLCVSRPGDEAAAPSEENPDLAGGFAEAFDVYPNGFPFLEGQVLLVSREHRPELSQDQYRQLFVFMDRTGFIGAALQTEGSGASIPGHAHVSVFDEPLPIFSSEYRELREENGATVAVSTDHPSLCYRISGEKGSVAVQDETLSILHRLKELGLSYNVYLEDGNAYVIPRTQRHSPTLGGKVGLSLASGTHNTFGDGPAANLEFIRERAFDDYVHITGDRLAAALAETTIQGENPATIFA